MKILKNLIMYRDILKNDYFKKADGNTMIEGAIKGMADSFNDPLHGLL